MVNLARNVSLWSLSLLSSLLGALGLVSLGVAAWQWGQVVSPDVTISEIVAIHARYTRTLLQLYLVLGGLLFLTGTAGAVAGALLLTDKLRRTAGLFFVVFLVAGFLLATAYMVMTSLLGADWGRADAGVLRELVTRVQGQAYLQNSFQFRSYWDAWQSDHGCCGVFNSTDFLNSAAAVNASDPTTWLPHSCCNTSATLAPCHRGSARQLTPPCHFSVSHSVTVAFWSQIGVMIVVWITFLLLTTVTTVVLGTYRVNPREEKRDGFAYY